MTRMPIGVKLAVAGLWVQAAANVFAAITLWNDIQSRKDHNQTVDEGAYPATVLVLALGAGLAVVAWFTRRRYRWVQITAVVYQGFGVLAGLVILAAGEPAVAMLWLLIPAAIAVGLLSGPARFWFDR